eukprot:TRINITY_DN53224_c0_g1_i1.p1 TRINITY_DN53224_c0_g1~~TRINITY_DN53224_c0_g1_i1.p1  ORF type:complete len:399 (-),score=100.74 TRINITY_DN53224_c0_g1_i1:36-1232(-)
MFALVAHNRACPGVHAQLLPCRRQLRIPEVRNPTYKVTWAHKPIFRLNCQLRTSDRKWDNLALREQRKLTGLMFGNQANDKVLLQFKLDDVYYHTMEDSFFTNIYDLHIYEDDERQVLLQNQLVIPKTLDWMPENPTLPYDITFQKWWPGKRVKLEIPFVIYGEEHSVACQRGGIPEPKVNGFKAIWKGDHRIPSEISFDMEELDFQEKVFMGDLQIPEGLTIIGIPKNYTVFKIRGRERSGFSKGKRRPGAGDMDEEEEGDSAEQTAVQVDGETGVSAIELAADDSDVEFYTEDEIGEDEEDVKQGVVAGVHPMEDPAEWSNGKGYSIVFGDAINPYFKRKYLKKDRFRINLLKKIYYEKHKQRLQQQQEDIQKAQQRLQQQQQQPQSTPAPDLKKK